MMLQHFLLAMREGLSFFLRAGCASFFIKNKVLSILSNR